MWPEGVILAGQTYGIIVNLLMEEALTELRIILVEGFFWNLVLTHFKLVEVPILTFWAPAMAAALALPNPLEEATFFSFSGSFSDLLSSPMAPIPPAPHWSAQLGPSAAISVGWFKLLCI